MTNKREWKLGGWLTYLCRRFGISSDTLKPSAAVCERDCQENTECHVSRVVYHSLPGTNLSLQHLPQAESTVLRKLNKVINRVTVTGLPETEANEQKFNLKDTSHYKDNIISDLRNFWRNKIKKWRVR